MDIDPIENNGSHYLPSETVDQVINTRPKTYYGENAVDQVRQREGELTSEMEYIIKHEGFVDGIYEDDAATSGIGKENVRTAGVGQTGEYIDMTFKDSFAAHRQKVVDMIPSFEELPEQVRLGLLSLVYRGDMKENYKWVGLLNEGKYEEAATELLDHKEYKHRKANNPKDGVVKRLDEASEYIRSGKYNTPFMRRAKKPANERKFIMSEDGKEQTHRMAAEVVDGIWYAFPLIVEQEDGQLKQYDEKDWMSAFEDNLSKNNVISFGKDKDKAIEFAEGGYKKGTPLE